MATVKGLYRCIDACNGEIRLQAVRYGSGWYCLVCVVEIEDNIIDKFEDLAGGDNDYFEAEKFFKEEKEGNYILTRSETPESAMSLAVSKAALLLEGYNDV